MIRHHVAAFGSARPGRSLTGKGDLLQAKARLVADHGAGTALALQAVAHSNAGWFALNCEVKLPAAAGGASNHGRLYDHPYPELLAQRAAIALPNRGSFACPLQFLHTSGQAAHDIGQFLCIARRTNARRDMPS
jgi:hypothetical protein